MCIINYTVKYFDYLEHATKFKVVTHLYAFIFSLRKKMMLGFFIMERQK